MSTTSTQFADLLTPQQRAFLETSFATNTSNFGGWRMEIEDPAEPAESVEDPVEPVVDPESPADPAEPEKPADEVVDPVEPPADEPNPDDGLSLEDAKAALAKVRREAAASRTRLNEMKAQLAEAKTPEQVDEIVNKAKADDAVEARTLLIENVALKHKLPDDLAGALKGDTREELEAHAKVLAKYAPVSETEDPPLGGGLDPTKDPDAFDPKAFVRKKRAGI